MPCRVALSPRPPQVHSVHALLAVVRSMQLHHHAAEGQQRQQHRGRRPLGPGAAAAPGMANLRLLQVGAVRLTPLARPIGSPSLPWRCLDSSAACVHMHVLVAMARLRHEAHGTGILRLSSRC